MSEDKHLSRSVASAPSSGSTTNHHRALGHDTALQPSWTRRTTQHDGARTETHDQDPGKYPRDQDPGLHPYVVQPYSGMEVDSSHGRLGSFSGAMVRLKDGKHSESVGQATQRGMKRGRKLKIFLVVLLCILIAAVVVTAVILVTRRGGASPASTEAVPTSTSGPSSSATSPSLPGSLVTFASLLPTAAVSSAKKARNGTALALFNSLYAKDGNYVSTLVYQDQDEKMNIKTINISVSVPVYNSSTVNSSDPVIMSNVQIAPGSSMTATNNAQNYRLIYADTNGTLNEMHTDADHPYSWYLFSMGAMGFPAPKQRSQMLIVPNNCFGPTAPQTGTAFYGGLRLWLTDDGGVAHHNAIAGPALLWWTGRWADNLTPGGPLNLVQLDASQTCDSSFAMINTDPSGRLSYFSGALVGNDTKWPTGPSWSGPYQVPSGPTLRYGSEVLTAFDNHGTFSIFYEEDGMLHVLNATKGGPGGLSFNSAPQSKNVTVMPGSAISGGYLIDAGKAPGQLGPLMLLFQSSPTSINWWIKSGDQEFTGSILS